MYDVGDIVKVRSKEWFDSQWFPNHHHETDYSSALFIPNIYKFCSKTFKIESRLRIRNDEYVYFLNSDPRCSFTAPMFELVIQFPIIE
jgi:hypothetical protein